MAAIEELVGHYVCGGKAFDGANAAPILGKFTAELAARSGRRKQGRQRKITSRCIVAESV